ncbi:phosphotransferase family protein [Asaia spathodeae]|uniref:Aminoglycoside phosphotransferase domain-containing protein n=1 Tax=Asaia spathodeae TaxID=657016 RepID=A0ABX2P1V0_9PROT|nr:hypothetical protein [Asaia spathodeae]
MAHIVTVIFDDRIAPSSDIASIIGDVSFARIVRRRQRLALEIEAAAKKAQSDFFFIKTDIEAHQFARHIETRDPGSFYFLLPSCIAPLCMDKLVDILLKAAFAVDTMLLRPVNDDVAPILLCAKDAVTLLGADDDEDRRSVLHRLADSAPCMDDHALMVDLRILRNLQRFLVGSTESRHFNDTSASSGIFYKRSSDIAKMEGEYKYFHVAPEEMTRFLMPTFGFWKKEDSAGYAMEHLPIPDVALQFLHGAFQPPEFDTLLESFFAFIASRKKGARNAQHTVAEGRRQILGKLEARLATFLDTEQGRKLDAILIASGPRGGLRDMHHDAVPFIERAIERFPDPHLVFGHGDPCFSNILFEKRLGFMRLIDPRGAVTFEAGLMHPLYDVAKFSHSVMGGYDFINNDLFSCSLTERMTLECSLDGGGPPQWMQTAFCGRLEKAGFDISAVRAVELSLFLSMLPLHSDRPNKLAGFALTAASILDRLDDIA